jgi:hypothetical protein
VRAGAPGSSWSQRQSLLLREVIGKKRESVCVM